MNDLFRAIPAMDLCLDAIVTADQNLANAPRQFLKEILVKYWEGRRLEIRSGKCQDIKSLGIDACLSEMLTAVYEGLAPRLKKIINATGVVVHTNLGRSVLAKTAQKAVALAASGYCNLELDLANGTRGSRHSLVEDLICKLSGAESAIAVNNNAAAVMLVLDEFCKGGEVIISRGELVEIGGSFRIPAILEKSGCKLREVGSTNRTHLSDYANAINEQTRAIIRVHTSNYRIIGFHSAVPLAELASLARERQLPLIEDLGSGSLVDFSQWGLPNEPTVTCVIASGADIVTFSGDKVLGGPQAGIIAGRKEYVQRLKKNQLARALRCDKLCLAALEATLRLYLDMDKAIREIPTLACICRSPEELESMARKLQAMIDSKLENLCLTSLRSDVSRVGGGAFPQRDLPTTLVCLKPIGISANRLKSALLQTDPPVIGRLEDEFFCLDPRTVPENEWPLLIGALRSAFKNSKPDHADIC